MRSAEILPLPPDEQTELLLRLSYNEIMNACTLSRSYAKVCKNKNFWQKKIDYLGGNKQTLFNQSIIRTWVHYIDVLVDDEEVNIKIKYFNKVDWPLIYSLEHSLSTHIKSSEHFQIFKILFKYIDNSEEILYQYLSHNMDFFNEIIKNSQPHILKFIFKNVGSFWDLHENEDFDKYWLNSNVESLQLLIKYKFPLYDIDKIIGEYCKNDDVNIVIILLDNYGQRIERRVLPRSKEMVDLFVYYYDYDGEFCTNMLGGILVSNLKQRFELAKYLLSSNANLLKENSDDILSDVLDDWQALELIINDNRFMFDIDKVAGISVNKSAFEVIYLHIKNGFFLPPDTILLLLNDDRIDLFQDDNALLKLVKRNYRKRKEEHMKIIMDMLLSDERSYINKEELTTVKRKISFRSRSPSRDGSSPRYRSSSR